MRYIFVAAILALIPNTAMAEENLKSFETANRLGSVIGSEEYCNLKYTQSAIEVFIETHVDAENMSFPSQLSGVITLVNFANKSRSTSAKTAHCVQIKRLAKAYKFID